MKAVIVIPTYNERKNIGNIIEMLCSEIIPSISGWDGDLLIVDGRSPDGTAAMVQLKQERHPNLHLLVEEKKEGIGAAYFKGFRYAMNQLQADVVIEFDGDSQHPPDSIPLLLAKINAGADCVLGSRAIQGGSYPAGWGLKRYLYSRLGGLFLRIILFFPFRSFLQITDPTTGLKATRVKGCLDQLEFQSSFSPGYAYKVEMLFRIVHNGGRIAEIPLAFQLRESGKSKITAQTPAEIFSSAIRLRLSSMGL